MPHISRARRPVLLALTLLSACAASDPGAGTSTHAARFRPTGVLGNFLAGRFALAESDSNTAANDFLRALSVRPNDQELVLQAFIAALDAGRPEVERLARQLPDNQVAQLVLADQDAKSGNWRQAEQRFRALPRQGLTQFLQPLLVAWAEQGAGRTDAALATLRPFVDSQRFRGIFALHSGMIADLAGRQAEAGRLFHIAQTELTDLNLRLAHILASWDVRYGQPNEARQVLASLSAVAPEATITVPNLLAAAHNRPVNSAADGVAEAYVAAGRQRLCHDHGAPRPGPAS
jgi:hypothetical protein